MIGNLQDNYAVTYIGNEVLPRAGILKIHYPIERGIINNWDDMEKIWNYTYNTCLNIDPKK